MIEKPNSKIVIVFLLGIMVIGCFSNRDLSSRSARLVGHWEVIEGGRRQVAVYFGPLDSNSVGSYVGLTGDGIYDAQYRILSENEDSVTIEVFVGNDLETLIREFVIVKDGKSMKSENLEYQYIDSSTQP